MGLNASLGYSRGVILSFFVAVTVLVTTPPAMAKINIEDCERLLQLAKANISSIPNDSIKVRLGANSNRIIVKNSLTAQAGIVRIDHNTLELPRAPLINRNYGLIEGQSKIFFIELAGDSSGRHAIGGVDNLNVYYVAGDIHPDLYHFLLAFGYIAITQPTDFEREENFSHDVLDHVPGYKKISQTSLWPKIKRLMLEVLYAETKLPPSSDIFQVATQIRFDVAAHLETYSARLSREDQLHPGYRNSLTELTAQLEKNFIFWQETKSVFNFEVPPDPFLSLEQALALRSPALRQTTADP